MSYNKPTNLDVFFKKHIVRPTYRIIEDREYGYVNLLSQRRHIEKTIKETPKEDVIDLGSLHAQLEGVEYKLQNFFKDVK